MLRMKTANYKYFGVDCDTEVSATSTSRLVIKVWDPAKCELIISHYSHLAGWSLTCKSRFEWSLPLRHGGQPKLDCPASCM